MRAGVIRFTGLRPLIIDRTPHGHHIAHARRLSHGVGYRLERDVLKHQGGNAEVKCAVIEGVGVRDIVQILLCEHDIGGIGRRAGALGIVCRDVEGRDAPDVCDIGNNRPTPGPISSMFEAGRISG